MKQMFMVLAILVVAGRSGGAEEQCPVEVGVGTDVVLAQQIQPGPPVQVQQGQRVVIQPGAAPAAQPAAAPTEHPEATAIRGRLQSYVDAFNKGDAAALGTHWTADGVSANQETGEQTVGRDAIVQELSTFFSDNPGASLSGEILDIRMIRPDVAAAEGRASVYLPDLDPIDSAMSLLFVKENGQWLISSSQERDLPAPPSSYDALKDLEFLVGTWQDDATDANVTTTIRWSPNRAFLIRSFSAVFADGEAYEGTQVIGWDPVAHQVRAWSFYSDGSFGEGTASRNGEDWNLKMSHVGSDGSLSAGTQVITLVDENTLSVQTIGETLDGEPLPTKAPVTVVRMDHAEGTSSSGASATEGGVQ